MADIAEACGISKALVFHYFTGKKRFYLYLMDFCIRLFTDEINARFDRGVTDFFERIKAAQNIKIAVIRQYPAVLDFLKSAYFETDKEVVDEIKVAIHDGGNASLAIFMSGTDNTKFKDDIDIKMVVNIITWCADGYISTLSTLSEWDVDKIKADFESYLNLLRQNFYKSEYI